LRPASATDAGARQHDLADAQRLEEAGARRAQHDVRVVHRQHRRVIGEAEHEAAVDQAAIVDRHRRQAW
jgi:hypothetical protein